MSKKLTYILVEFLSTGFYTGYFPKISGTVGTLPGVLIFLLIGSNFWLYTIITIIFIILTIPITDYAEKYIFKEKDPHPVVLDEVTGFLIAVWGFYPYNLNVLIFGFILFRIMDIVKPYPLNEIQKFKGGLGIAIDDIFAGVIANIIMRAFAYFYPEMLPLLWAVI